MNSIDLSMFVEFGVGLAGFSGVVAAFGLKSDDRFRIILLLAFALVPAFVSTVPTVLAGFGLSDVEATRSLGIVLSACLVFLIALPFLLVRRLSATARSNLSRVIWQVGIGGTLLALAWNVLNLLGWPQPISAGPVVATLVWLLFMASLMFLRLLLARVRASHPDS